MKGLFSAYFMKYFCQDAGIPGNEIYKYFDIISGTSIGGIQALGYANGLSPDDMIDFFITQGPNIFSPPVSSVQKINTLLYGDETFYTNTVLKEQITSIFGTMKMFQLKTNVLITSVEVFLTNIPDVGESIYNFRPVFFSNVNLPGFEGKSYAVSDVALATSAAPLYFPSVSIPEVTTPNTKYIDGGTYMNNTSAGIWALSNAVHPSSNRVCLLSVGTGLGTVGLFDPQPVTPPTEVVLHHKEYKEFLTNKGYTSGQINDIFNSIIPDFGNVYLLLDLVSLEITGPQEAINKQLQLQALYGSKINNKDLFYYRFNTVYDPTKNTELDSATPEFLAYMQQAAQEQYNKDRLKIASFIQKLNA
jgi:Patatin-like phospholipase